MTKLIKKKRTLDAHYFHSYIFLSIIFIIIFFIILRIFNLRMGTAISTICSINSVNMRERVYSESYENSKEIDKQLENEAKMKKKLVKMLLLGASDSGKSTIVKQMRILHSDGFSDEERRLYRFTILGNCLDSISHIARGIKILKIKVPSREKELVERFSNSFDGHLTNWMEFREDARGEHLTELMSSFLNFDSTKIACQSFNDFYAPDNTEYILENADRILNANYEPKMDDIIRARASTRGIYEINFAFKNFTIRLIDVGGQKTERRKWIHSFEGVDAILFIVSLSCYNQMLIEDPQINQMVDSLNLFKNVFQNKFLCKSFFVIFFNKKDLFAKKVENVPLENYFPEFKEKINSEMNLNAESLKFIKQKFIELKGNEKRQIYSHITNATDSRNIDFVFTATCDNVIANNIKNAGMS